VGGLAPGASLGGITVQLGDITFNQVDQAGVYWYCASYQGWDSPDVRADMTVRAQDHGAWPVEVFYGARAITLAGKIMAPSMPLADVALEQLFAAASLTDTVLTIGESIPKRAVVRRSGAVMAQRVNESVVDWSVIVSAADPRRYGTDLQSGATGLPITSGGLAPPLTPPLMVDASTVSGQVAAANAGTFETRPVLVLDGPASQPQIVAEYPDGTRFLSYSQDLDAGDQLVIDTDAHTATLNGAVSRRRFLTVPNGWPTIPAAGTVLYQFTAAAFQPAARLTVQWRSAWA
jgi:Phage tail protein